MLYFSYSNIYDRLCRFKVYAVSIFWRTVYMERRKTRDGGTDICHQD